MAKVTAVVFLNANLWLLLIEFATIVASAQQTELAKANNHFALGLYMKVGNENKGSNVFFSPVSISTAFGMVNLGAKGNTKKQLETVFHLDKIGSDSVINEAYKQMLSTFKRQDTNHTLHLVNRLFGSNTFNFKSQFLQDSQNNFNASLETLDFSRKPDSSRVHVNDWVAKETKDMIKDLLPPGSIETDTALVLVNAIYFKAFWEYPFEKSLTKPGTFHVSKSEQVQMDMMSVDMSHRGLQYYNSVELECQVLELPYHGGKASMFIFLPRDIEGLSKLEQRLTWEKISEALDRTQNTAVEVKFPKFKMDQSISLKEFLQSMGMTDIFSRQVSDLSGIGSGPPLYVSNAFHKAHVNVDEAGTEAAAATAIIVVPMSLPINVVDFTVDRPFLFLILEKNTNTILFLGRLIRPPVSSDVVGKFGETGAQKSDGGKLSSWNVLNLISSTIILIHSSRVTL